MSDTVNETMVIKCGCGANMRVRASAAGKKAKCPKCAAIVPIPAPQARPSPAAMPFVASKPVAADSPTEPDDLLPLETPAAVELTAVENRCPQCKVVMAADAKICISCGYNVETGKSLKAAGAAPGKVVAAAKSLGTFAIGTGLSGAGAAVGATIWFIVDKNTGYTIGYLAWGIGVLAGLGMRWGHRTGSAKAGVMAAGMAALGVLGAQAAIFIFVLIPIISGHTDDIDLQREYITLQMTDEKLDERGVDSEQDREKQWDAVYEEASKQVAGMSDEAVRSKWKEYQEKEAAESPEEEEEATTAGEGEGAGEATESESESATEGETSAEDASSGLVAVLMLFLVSSFGLFDLLWFFLAISSAYKIGRGAAVGET